MELRSIWKVTPDELKVNSVINLFCYTNFEVEICVKYKLA